MTRRGGIVLIGTDQSESGARKWVVWNGPDARFSLRARLLFATESVKRDGEVGAGAHVSGRVAEEVLTSAGQQVEIVGVTSVYRGDATLLAGGNGGVLDDRRPHRESGRLAGPEGRLNE